MGRINIAIALNRKVLRTAYVMIRSLVKNNNSHMYRDDDKIKLKQNMCEIKEYIQVLIEQKI